MKQSRWMMKRKMLLLSLAAITLSSLAAVVPGTNQGSVQASASEVSVEASERVLEATVRITIITDNASDTMVKSSDDGQLLASGSEAMGTLVQDGNDVYLVTHDHWSQLTNNLNKVQLHNAHGDLLVELERAAFYALIRYRDGGTLVLEAPEELSSQMRAVQASWGDQDQEVKAGDELLMAYWKPGAGEQVSVERVTVTSIEDHDGVSSLKLRNLSGKAVVQGNSGGGVFKDDLLVANMWSTVVLRQQAGDGQDEMAQTDQSRAAEVNFEQESNDDLAVERGRQGGGEI
jgi:hypothetical protein